MKIGDLVIRTDKYDKRNTEHRIGSERDLKYHLDLQAQGYEYHVVGAKEEDFDFDLPESSGAPSAPKIHVGGSVCTSCEG
jgi:hypothetical protein